MRVRPNQTPRWQLSELADLVGGSTSDEAVVTGLALNTGQLVDGDLYVALPGANAHGGSYVEQARDRGASAVLTDDAGAALVGDTLPTIVVDAPRRRLAGLSAAFYDHPAESFQTLGITGTQGKTTTTYLAEAALGDRVSAVVGTIGTRIGKVPAASTLTTPEAPQLQALFAVMREEAVELCAMEVSSHALVQGRVDGFVFDVAVFLNLGRDHLDFHHDLEDYFLAKAALFTPERARHAVVNVDDAHGRRLRELTPLPVTTFSTDGNPADWRGVNIRPHRLGTDLEVLGPDGLAIDLSVPLPGAFNVSNALAVVAALATIGHDPAELAAGIASSTGVPGRMERVGAGQPFTAIVDYAHKPDAVTAVLTALRPVTAGRLIIVIGAGGDRDHGKRPLMGEAAARHADVVIVTDDNPRSERASSIRTAVMEGAAAGPGLAIEVADRRDAIEHAVAMAHLGDTVVVAGKGHERGQEVDGIVHSFDDREVLVELIEAGA
ncbi:UDP-N-acetylmuramoyl-L-alanyl-D-glutamate--2,6-diaminopimelate ligase [Aeromicrobium endophyticum]|uniref:UDP-N-acetylmuramoyl-L-alanyl-D-glutamate--2,6-diaminopimelate ligase n=2 Tax=Aeromicrobium endophyticum TaxID=2292704 RepID=A0A371P3A0_9ACTN|nr:UDP-N-acetylmuramoyl-L-alanyl-D-glutamate--2,6-diaminopimelate ligase [Aeromicrobium endophyticum]